jgi:hypothetical protein
MTRKKDSHSNHCLWGGGCKNSAISRGLCFNHYRRSSYRVSRGEISWKELVRRGEAAEPTRVIDREWFAGKVDA